MIPTDTWSAGFPNLFFNDSRSLKEIIPHFYFGVSLTKINVTNKSSC